MEIPNDPKYAGVAGKYVVEIAGMIGFDDRDCRSIESGVSQAVTAVIDYSFEPGEKQTLRISCERIPEGLKVSIRDKGLPYGETRVETEDRSGEGPGLGSRIFQLRDYLDEVVIHNLGHAGKEVILIKHLQGKGVNDYYEACELEPYEEPAGDGASPDARLKCTARRMRDSEAPEVSKSVYKTYGYSYPFEYVYYPEKIVALNEGGKIHSAVALVGESEIAGHGALLYWDENPQIAEMAQGFVKPEYRSLGCFAGLTEYLVEHARSEGLMGVFAKPVTNHTYSQQAGYRLGLEDCGLMHAHVPITATFKAMDETLPRRVGVLLLFKYLNRPAGTTIHPPRHHREMILKIYENLGVSPSTLTSGEEGSDPTAQDSVFRVKVFGPANFALVVIERYGRDVVMEIRARLRELCLKKIEVVNLYLDLSDSLTSRVTGQFEELGFFFAGLLPGGLPGTDALILQYLNNVPVNYDEIRVASDMAEELVSYIRNLDPNLQ
jgi:serine/threonine-protein kinase RsbW